MVRYFSNPYKDYKHGASLALDKNEIISQINEHTKNITKRLQPHCKNVDGGLYAGITGVSYMFYYLAKNPLLTKHKTRYIEKAVEYLSPALKTTPSNDRIRKIYEAGLMHRLKSIWDEPKPPCVHTPDTSIFSVTLGEFSSALTLLALGIAFAVVILIVEIAFYKYKEPPIKLQH